MLSCAYQNKLQSFIRLISFLLLSSISVQAQVTPGAAKNVPAKAGTTTPKTIAGYASGTVVNYVRTWTPQQPYIQETEVASTSRTVNEVNRSTQYSDGLGRPIQTVGWRVSSSEKDVVAPVVYDEFGREQYKYLAYASTDNSGSFKTNPFGDQSIFYSTAYPTEEQGALQNEQFYYSHTVFEPSPLNRVSKTFAPGNTWAGSEIDGTISRASSEKAVSVLYLINNASDQVRIWDIGFAAVGDANNIPTSATGRVYEAGQLYKTVTLDEHNNAVVEYKDKGDHVVLKKVQIGSIAADYSGYGGFLCTYYVYDDLGQLRFVIPPKAVIKLANTGTGGYNWNLVKVVNGTNDYTLINELCFRYEYDERQRMIAKKVPGAAWVYMVYDSRDRLIYTQDGNMRGKSTAQWAYTFYDDLNRPIETGMMTYSGTWANLKLSAATATNPATATTTGKQINSLTADLLVGARDYTVTNYNATNSITLQDGFSTEDGANGINFEILAAAAPSFSYPETVNMKPVPAAGTGTYAYYPLTYTYYDNYTDYNFSVSKNFTTTYNGNLSTGDNTIGIEDAATAKSGMTKGLPTGSRVRVIEDPADFTKGAWLETVTYYDDKGRVLQVHSDNYKGGKDVIVNRYNFTNKVVSTYLIHTNPAADKGSNKPIGVYTGISYDHAGRITRVKKRVDFQGTSYERFITDNSYDALGQLKNKQLGKKTLTGNPIENDDYTYNIRGWLKGVNWYKGTEYASQIDPASTIKPKWFAFDLSYDWGMTVGSSQYSQYNGNIAGQRWKSAGDGKERAYGYTYDPANRLLQADFTQQNGSNWNTTEGIDFTVKMGNGTEGSAYDENGNIKQMRQWGLKGVSSAPIDQLTYNYSSSEVGNRLTKVTEDPLIGSASNNLGDFTDKNRDGTDDYSYDINGNLIADKNKKITGIIYNHLNLPWQITVKNDNNTDKGTITYIYDALGNKLEKRTSEAASSYNSNVARQTQTAYIGGLVYENNVLQFVGHEEGRARMVQTVVSGTPTTSFVFDYFLKDHLGNVRMVLTDEQKTDTYPTLDFEGAVGTTAVANQDAVWDNNTGGTVNVLGTRTAFNMGNSTDNGTYSKLIRKQSAGGAIGASKLLKVMSGDQISTSVDYYWPSAAVDNTKADGIGTLTTSLLSVLLNTVGVSTSLKGATTAVNDGLTADPNVIGKITNPENNVSGSAQPKAYLHVLLFNEQFQLDNGNSYVLQIKNTPNVKDNLAQLVTVNKNGYAYIYFSNESNNDIYFDNFTLSHVRGPLLEETHYYPFGLTMAGISSKAAGGVENRKKWNKNSELENKEFSDGSGFELYSTQFRSLDPQLGRFWQIDPSPDYSQSLYSSMNNNPILYNDPLGDSINNPRDQRIAARMEGNINGQITRNNQSITNSQSTITANNAKLTILRANVASGTLTGKDLKSASKEIGKLESANNKANSNIAEMQGQNAQLNESLNNITALRNDVNFNYTFGGAPGFGSGEHGVLRGNGNNVIVQGSNNGLYVHEIRHIGQSLANGGLRFSTNPATLGRLLNAGTNPAQRTAFEVDAYQAQFSLDINSYPAPGGARVLSDINATSLRTIIGDNGTPLY
jgi:RHS repeat-associated protein